MKRYPRVNDPHPDRAIWNRPRHRSTLFLALSPWLDLTWLDLTWLDLTWLDQPQHLLLLGLKLFEEAAKVAVAVTLGTAQNRDPRVKIQD